MTSETTAAGSASKALSAPGPTPPVVVSEGCAACIATLHVLPGGVTVPGAAQRIVAVRVVSAIAQIARVVAALVDALQSLAGRAAHIFASAALERLHRL